MITETTWGESVEHTRPLTSEEDIWVLTPYKNSITLMRKHGGLLVVAKHDGLDEKGDIEMLKMLCLYRYSGGGTNV